MIILNHINSINVSSITKDGKTISIINTELTHCFWEICEKFPDELIIWIDEGLDIKPSDNLHNIFPHDFIMASYPVGSNFLPDSIGYIDQFPFIKPDYSVRYPTWRMSTDIGGINSRIALKFKTIFYEIKNFGYLINSMAKIGQQNSLFCYTDPNLIKCPSKENYSSQASCKDLFNFVAQHYKQQWLFVLLFCFIYFEKKLPLWIFFKSFLKKSWFHEEIDLGPSHKRLTGNIYESEMEHLVDVVIPTLSRPEYLKQVLIDLKDQSYLPSRIIIIEQNPDITSKSELDFLQTENWPFEIIHHFIHQTGACNARNIGLNSVKGDWVFFADDDIRLGKNLIKNALQEIFRLKIDCLNLNCIQPGEKITFNKVKQWAAFGSGTSIVRATYALKCHFSEALEFGFGEDIDFGMQLRSYGCDVIYHPDLKMMHLKADSGGFRKIIKVSEETSKEIEPKPSPTMMWLIKKYYSAQMIKGYKISLFLKFYLNQNLKNPFSFTKLMNRRWQLSYELSEELSKSSTRG